MVLINTDSNTQEHCAIGKLTLVTHEITGLARDWETFNKSPDWIRDIRPNEIVATELAWSETVHVQFHCTLSFILQLEFLTVVRVHLTCNGVPTKATVCTYISVQYVLFNTANEHNVD
jgi:hypothetical protein